MVDGKAKTEDSHQKSEFNMKKERGKRMSAPPLPVQNISLVKRRRL